MRRVATSWWDHAQFPSSPPIGAFPDSLHDHHNHSPPYVDLPPPHHPAFVDPWMYPPVTPATTTTIQELSPPMDALTQMVTALDEDAAATTMSVTEEALRNYMVEEEELRRRAQQQQQEEQWASYAQLQLFSPSHRQEFLDHYHHHPLTLFPAPTGPILSPHARSSFAVYHPYPPAFVPVVTTRKKPPAKRKRMASPKKKKIIPEKKETTVSTGETEDSASTNRLKPILLDDDAATTHSSKCESKPPPDPTMAVPPTHAIPPPKQPRTTKSRVVVDLAGGTTEPASALRALAKHEVDKAVLFIAIPPPLSQPPTPTQPTPRTVQLVPPTPTPTQPDPVPILPRGRVISPWTDDGPEEHREDLWQLLREDDIWSVASSLAGRRDATEWNDDPEMVSLLCDALDL